VLGILLLAKGEQSVRVVWQFRKGWQAWDIVKRTCKDAFRMAAAVQETCSSGMLGGAGVRLARLCVGFWFA